MRKCKYLTVLALGLLLGPMALSAFAGDSNGIEFIEDGYTWEVYVPCLNEVIFESAVLRVSYQEFETPSGNFHLIDNWKVTNFWTGLTSGDEWVGGGNSPFQLNEKADKGAVLQYVSNFHMKPLSEGAPPVKVQFRFKLTVNANGEVIVERFDPTFRCLGPKK